MANALLFIPDISGFTQFVQNTEAQHSQHVIAELLELLINANILELQLAEVEGDALFFYKTSIPSQEKLLAQIETMFTAFYGHLRLLEKNSICTCQACATAPQLELKIVAHCGEMQFITVQGNHKPFGKIVIEAHRLLKNSIQSDNYTLLTQTLAEAIELPSNYKSKLYQFQKSKDTFDTRELTYFFSKINPENLDLLSYEEPRPVSFDSDPNWSMEQIFPISEVELIEWITNYKYRYLWVEGVDEFLYNQDEVTRLGTEHTCVINGKHLNFETVTKPGHPGELIYGEVTKSLPIVDEFYQFFTISPIDSKSCKLNYELYWNVRSPIKKLILALFAKKVIIKNSKKGITNLYNFILKKG